MINTYFSPFLTVQGEEDDSIASLWKNLRLKTVPCYQENRKDSIGMQSYCIIIMKLSYLSLWFRWIGILYTFGIISWHALLNYLHISQILKWNLKMHKIFHILHLQSFCRHNVYILISWVYSTRYSDIFSFLHKFDHFDLEYCSTKIHEISSTAERARDPNWSQKTTN